MGGSRSSLMLDRAHLIAMVGDPGFYDKCPAFSWLRDAALATAAYCNEHKKVLCCGKEWALTRDHVVQMVEHLVRLHKIGPEHVECVRDYVAAKKGYNPGRITVFFRPAYKKKVLRFTF